MAELRRETESESVYLTAVEPFGLDYETQYPLLAIRAKYSEAVQTRIRTRQGSLSWLGSSPLDGMQICAKDTYLLTADLDGRFKWIPPHHSRLYKPQVVGTDRSEGRKRQTRYSLEENLEESNVIYPVRPFSITNVSLEGFDPSKAYPVLAIDTDKYLPEEEPGAAEPPEGPQTETMAFFLVGDDNGEFVWVAEEECKLYPLKV